MQRGKIDKVIEGAGVEPEAAVQADQVPRVFLDQVQQGRGRA